MKTYCWLCYKLKQMYKKALADHGREEANNVMIFRRGHRVVCDWRRGVYGRRARGIQ